jgi:hypothetical protein
MFTEKNVPAAARAAQYTQPGFDLFHLSLDGKFLQRLRAAAGLATLGPIITSIKRRDITDPTHIFMARARPPKRPSNVIAWIQTSLRYPLGWLLILNLIIVTTDIIKVAVMNPAQLASTNNLMDIIWVLILVALRLDAHSAMKQAEFF